MSSPIPSDISQNDTEILEEQHCKIQRRHKKKQQLQAHLEEVAETYHIEHTAQKARKAVEAKTREKVEKWRIAEEEERKKWMKYL